VFGRVGATRVCAAGAAQYEPQGEPNTGDMCGFWAASELNLEGWMAWNIRLEGLVRQLVREKQWRRIGED